MTMRSDSSGKLQNSAIVLRLAIEFQKTFKTILPCQDLPSVYRGRWLWWAFASAEPQFLFWSLNDSPPYPGCIYNSTTPSSLVQHIHIVFVGNAVFSVFQDHEQQVWGEHTIQFSKLNLSVPEPTGSLQFSSRPIAMDTHVSVSLHYNYLMHKFDHWTVSALAYHANLQWWDLQGKILNLWKGIRMLEIDSPNEVVSPILRPGRGCQSWVACPQ